MKKIALVLLGLLAGNELAVGAFVHPALSRLPLAARASSVRSLAQIFGRVMPFWMAATLVALLLASRGEGESKGPWRASAALMAIAIAASLAGPVPINTRIVSWDVDRLPAEWQSDASRWLALHNARTVVLLAAFVAAVRGR